jgi:hypothetical protein
MRLLLIFSSALLCWSQWIDICSDRNGNECCASTGMKESNYNIETTSRSWEDQQTDCLLMGRGSRLVVFESQRENDCLTAILEEGLSSTPLA